MDAEIGSLAGSLLVSHPSLRDPNFHRTVVLMSMHDDNGAMGLVLNRPMGKTLGEFSSDFAIGALAKVPLFKGGPVEEDRLLLCAWRFHPEATGFQLLVGLDPERAVSMVEESGMHLRAFFGYAGWTGGQLEREMKDKAWVNVPMVPNLLDLEQDQTLWRALLLTDDPMWKLHAEEPRDPELN
ncbi:YqgE/AlgH family protein [Nibricoccus sp. IMCC34717]|uniref:YqgE/AlgH family protein n=1 Tax=Nibricoccus sp. IMCC34717 TaxID=3034021 RepID=UPI003851496B